VKTNEGKKKEGVYGQSSSFSEKRREEPKRNESEEISDFKPPKHIN